MEINLNEEDVNKFVKDALLKSCLGAAVQGAVNEIIKKTYDNPINKAIEHAVYKVAVELVENKFIEQIKSAIEKGVQEKLTPEAVDQMTDRTITKIVNAMKSY